jgi:ribosomal protein S27AE
MATAPQRAWRAACPNCGAPVEFLSPASASAVCGFCRSTLVRDGESLRKIGTSAEVFDDFTPLTIGASGTYQGARFMLVGRLQFGTDAGPWNEWHALFDNGRSGWLSEDNGRYVFAFDAPVPAGTPLPERLQAGSPVTVDGRPWRVASVVRATLLAAQGELVQPPPSDRAIVVSDLRNTADEVGTLESVDGRLTGWSTGRSVRLADLGMSGLRESGIGGAGEKTLKAQSPPCPNCGAPLKITLATTQSVVCDSCKSVVDLSQGIGPDMAHYAQVNRTEPGIPLGRTGTLPIPSGAAPLPWQVVGYMERMELMSDGSDEAEAWREYLLYNRQEGFAFLVDTNEGWSVVRVLTGVPESRGDQATWYGTRYQRRWTYTSETTYVLGEFYWKVEAQQRTQHEDYEGSASGHRAFLSKESTANETTWSAGESIPAPMVAQVFGLDATAGAQLQRGGPMAGGGASLGDLVGAGGLISWPALIVLLVVVLMLLAWCSQDSCRDVKRAYGSYSAEYRQCRARSAAGTGAYYGTGGAWGGYSSGGGGHK